MNFNKIFKSTLSAACIASMTVTGTSCIDYNDNVNPNEVTDDMMASDNLRTGAFFRQMLRRILLVRDGDLIVDSDYQIAQNLTHDAYAGYATQTLGNAGNHNQYSWNNQWVRSTYNFAYTGIMSAWNQLNQVAGQNEQAEIQALGNVVKVLGMHRIADSFGPLNYVTFGADGNFNPLEDVYAKFFEELDAAIDVLTQYANTGARLMSDYDLVYGGDVTNWVKLANTLRLRLAMRVVYADEALAKAEAEKSINHPLGFIDSKGNRPVLSGHYHPIVTIAYEFGDGPTGSGGDCVPSASIVTYMANMNDGRISK
ncbi:MAG: SusD/RagB family nutrient-binding outer membrane lipoprotein, partial [Muribaculaceae bacterium]|nr:SusD/RagB family nutrient-binding outer membrane lipoprotein [Muribaculaceae bacterium]